MKLWQKLGKRPTNGDVGIEIEVEGENLPKNLEYWRVEADSSLRGNSCEYVLRHPMSIKDAKQALDELETRYNKNNTVVNDSIRTGVHVHVNVSQLEENQVWNFVCCYMSLEPLLVNFCGKYRVGNLFCLRCEDAEALLMYIKAALVSKAYRYRLLYDDEIRYASMNLKALAQYGSIEFRSMRGTRDLNVINEWAETLVALRDFACGYENPRKLMEDFFTNPTEFAAKALGERFGLFAVDNLESVLKFSSRYANDVAHYRNWDEKDGHKVIGGLRFDEEDEALEPPGDF